MDFMDGLTSATYAVLIQEITISDERRAGRDRVAAYKANLAKRQAEREAIPTGQERSGYGRSVASAEMAAAWKAYWLETVDLERAMAPPEAEANKAARVAKWRRMWTMFAMPAAF